MEIAEKLQVGIAFVLDDLSRQNDKWRKLADKETSFNRKHQVIGLRDGAVSKRKRCQIDTLKQLSRSDQRLFIIAPYLWAVSYHSCTHFYRRSCGTR